MSRQDEFGPHWVTAFSIDLPRLAAAGSGQERRRTVLHRRAALGRRIASAGAPGSTAAVLAVRPGPRARNHRQHSAHVLPQELFLDLLAREHRRTERYDSSSALILVGFEGMAPATASAWWPRVIDALTAGTGGLAIIGWFEQSLSLGAIAPELPGVDVGLLLRRELALRLRAEVAARVTVRVQRHTAEGRAADASRSPQRRAATAGGQTRDRVKRAFDLVGSLSLVLLLAPIFAVVAALVKLTSPGPILFRQKRVGQQATPFTMLKFRTMKVDADPGVHQAFVTSFIKSGAQLHPVGRKVVFKLTRDKRVTPLGRILRKSSLDELPQLWNVVRGEMSLVGPRPPLPYEVDQYHRWHLRRVLDAKPGITGLWQVRGRSRTTFDEMVRLDLQYARTYSLWMDIRILLATPWAVISGKGAA